MSIDGKLDARRFSGTAAVGEDLIRVGPLNELKQRGCTVVTGGGHIIAVYYHDGHVYAVDNRCPHMGFPLSRGTVCDGILTCHWHHARFDLATGGTFDPFADDVAVHAVRVVDGMVWVDPQPTVPPGRRERLLGRLEDGLEQGLGLVTVKSVLGLLDDPAAILGVGARVGTTQRAAGWGAGLTILTAMANALDRLGPEEQALALFHGLSHVADDCAGAPPRCGLDPLPTTDIEPARLRRWFRDFVGVRNADGAERALLTAIESSMPAPDVCEMMVAAATDRFFVDGGHTVDFINKAFELLERVGWEQASTVLPSLVRGLARSARRSEEHTS